MSHVKVQMSSRYDLISFGFDLISVYGMLIRGMALHHTITKVNYKNKIKFNLRNNSCSPNVLTMLDSVSRSLVFLKPKVFISRHDLPEVSHEIHAICLPRSSFKICLNRKVCEWLTCVKVYKWWCDEPCSCSCVIVLCHIVVHESDHDWTQSIMPDLMFGLNNYHN